MLRIFYITKTGDLIWEKNPKDILPGACSRMVWVDLQSSSEDERQQVESTFKIELYTQQEASEIESSSRYYEDDDTIEANNSFIVYANKSFVPEQVSFIIKKEILFTLRRADIKSFADTVRKLKLYKNPLSLKGFHIFLLILELQIDLDADFIEQISRTTNNVSKRILKEKSYQQNDLITITELQENTIMGRESMVDKQRLVSSLLKSETVDISEKERLRIVMKDVSSIMQHAEFGFERLEFLQNTFLGLLSIDQNQVIKIFTVVTVIFMPPTLIASIYGMNFDIMPEKNWTFGYPFAIVLMIMSSLVFLWYFKRKKWL